MMPARGLCLLGALFLSIFIEGHAADVAASGATAVGRQLKAQPHDYNYIRHGADWGGLGSCDGNAQSPIDILTAEALDPSERSGVSGVSFNDLPSAELTDVKVNLEQDMKFSFLLPEGISLPTITIDGTEQTFKPLQVHFHHFSSEHTVDGMAYPLESHMVMQSNQDDNQLAVLGIFYRYGEADPFLTRLQDAARGRVNQGQNSFGDKDVPVDVTVNVLEDLLPDSLDYYGYDGSLTTPPCSEIVKWHVFATPRTVSIEQLKVFNDVTLGAHADAYTTNNRIIEPRNGRNVYEYQSPKATIEAVYGIEFETGTVADSAFDKFAAGTRIGCNPDNCDAFTGPERRFIEGVQRRAREATSALTAEITDIVVQQRRRSLLQANIADLTITYTFDQSTTANPVNSVESYDGSTLSGSSSNGLSSATFKSAEDTTPDRGNGASIRVGLGLVLALIMSVVLAL
ncbi:carbonic anhydrase [Dunaliella salina]|uniref:carbonic anhydrase n=1 Tax=Dunaliella salina TaxID=3046 RepID=A0A172R2C9_DUNSA|nr:carbonic anhydrase 1 [Dunaliella salina]KAF5841504.1 carbonic anhydrase [Dunaliella salina]|eukprot:KAF5841504.1 carbonic anhydrase [Dunaliella salina]